MTGETVNTAEPGGTPGPAPGAPAEGSAGGGPHPALPPLVDLAALGEEFTRDPYRVYAGLRARGPVHRVRMPEGAEAWLVVGYAEARAALADPRLSKDWENASPSLGLRSVASGAHMLNSDPPRHSRLRRLVAGEFTPRRVEALRPRVEEMAGGLVDAMLAAPDGRADLVSALSFPLPMAVICELLGVPDLDREAFRELSDAMVTSTDRARRAAATEAASQVIAGLVESRRRDPGEDLVSALVRATGEDGSRLTDHELMGTVWLLLVAGFETTVNLISNAVLALLTHPGALAEVRADPSLADRAVEETLRWDGPVATPTYRFTTEPVAVGATVIPGGGALVLPCLADADRDPARFPGGEDFDLHRPPGGHLAFGHGIHHCLGAPLARLEGRTALRVLLDRCPDLALDAHPAALSHRGGMMMRGPRRLPVRWRA
ncbi:cytochrome P450 family protein [Streptomyces zingiberis]|uniref:Cytochrome P450 n=1 Tax=Streptomyces zingiberis TaxID=2053010 RepID=A0ABX1BYN3_9ACTN|nr:cytochrome P450 [Streptomyces zingiberis]NJQ02804.1 cytochrome P450 [Streptomyces zingiberis]